MSHENVALLLNFFLKSKLIFSFKVDDLKQVDDLEQVNVLNQVDDLDINLYPCLFKDINLINFK